jgi:phage tail protein X
VNLVKAPSPTSPLESVSSPEPTNDSSQPAADAPSVSTLTPESTVAVLPRTAEHTPTVIASLAQDPSAQTSEQTASPSTPEVKGDSSSEQTVAASSSAVDETMTPPLKKEPRPLQPSASSSTDSKDQAIIVARGDTVSELVLKVYGNYSALALDLIKEFNPSITDLDRILIGQRLILPSLSRETLLRQQDDGKFRLILGTFVREIEAQRTAQAARRKGYNATVIKRRVAAGARSLYRVELEELPDTAAVDRAWELVDGIRS